MNRARMIWAGVLAAAAIAVGGGVAGAAVMASAGGPTVQNGPGPYYSHGAVGICVNKTTQAMRFETGSALATDKTKFGNCAANEVQLVVVASPEQAAGFPAAPAAAH